VPWRGLRIGFAECEDRDNSANGRDCPAYTGGDVNAVDDHIDAVKGAGGLAGSDYPEKNGGDDGKAFRH
ncbi:MAG: hypothetical protein K8S25_06650, partial [Alphaproteobacteria bacterium]|nr:hypothetical protein [Alphaproteobacteria bacterium]